MAPEAMEAGERTPLLTSFGIVTPPQAQARHILASSSSLKAKHLSAIEIARPSYVNIPVLCGYIALLIYDLFYFCTAEDAIFGDEDYPIFLGGLTVTLTVGLVGMVVYSRVWWVRYVPCDTLHTHTLSLYLSPSSSFRPLWLVELLE